MSGMFNVNLNGQKISIKVGEKLEEIKKKLGNPDNTIFTDVDVNNDGKLDATELEKLKTSLVDNDYEIDVAADGKTPKVAYNQAIQNLKGSYDAEKLKSRYKEDDKYTIKRGDTLYEIAKNQLEAEGLPTDDFRAINNRIAQIANLNDLSDVNNIPVGTELIIKLTDEAIEEVKAKDNDSAAAFEGDDEADGDDWTSYGPIKSRGNTEVDNDKNEGSFTAGFESTITVSENGLNMGKGQPVDADGNNVTLKDPKFKAGGCIMKYQKGDKVMYQILFNNDWGLLSGVKLYAPSIAELNELKSKCVAAINKIKTAPEGETEEAIKSYELAIKYNENYDIAYNNLGVIYLDDLGRVKQAADLFKKSIECNPNYALAHFNLARAIAITGDKIEAAKLYQVAQDINKITNEIDPQDILDKINALFE